MLARHIRDHHEKLKLILMQHHTPVPEDLHDNERIQVRFGDLAKPDSLYDCFNGADIIVHFAGVLFRARPETFLHETNVQYFRNLVATAKQCAIKKVILISFPHVEGPTTRAHPATGRLDGRPVSVHAQTRLEEEKLLFDEIVHPVSLRVGMVYGNGILMADAARWFAKHRLLGVWKRRTQIHLISKTDFCRTTVAAIAKDSAHGIYHVGDDGNDSLQSFLDFCCDVWGYHRPWRMPLGLIYTAARLFEFISAVFGTKSPLTRDFIDIGRVDYYGDTDRFRKELLPRLEYGNVHEGIEELG